MLDEVGTFELQRPPTLSSPISWRPIISRRVLEHERPSVSTLIAPHLSDVVLQMDSKRGRNCLTYPIQSTGPLPTRRFAIAIAERTQERRRFVRLIWLSGIALVVSRRHTLSTVLVTAVLEVVNDDVNRNYDDTRNRGEEKIE